MESRGGLNLRDDAMIVKAALIMPAAGVGVRFDAGRGTRKPYRLLGGKPIVLRTLARFKDIPSIVQRVLVLHPDDVDRVRETWRDELAQLAVTEIVPGGANRQESISHGLAVLRDEIEVVAVHDAVRPFVSRTAIEQSIAKAVEVGGAVVACRITATVKRADPLGRIIETVPREELWMAQTPQTFRKDILLRAYAAAAEEGVLGTDDSALVERIGQEAAIVEEGPANLKITTPDDLKIAEAMLR